MDFANGHVPKEIHFLVKRYEAADLPEPSDQLQSWLSSRWSDKEKILQKYHSGPQRSFDGVKEIYEDRGQFKSLLIWFGLGLWTTISLVCTYLLIAYWWARLYFVLTFALFIIVERFCGGMEKLQFQLARRNIGV